MPHKTSNYLYVGPTTEQGFTLIELMIVVGIIGILVSIAAPNFARYQSRARQSEAKIALSTIYASEKSFYAEYTSYITSMDALGYEPEGNKRFYTVGFSRANTTKVTGYTGSYKVPSFPRVNYPSSWNKCNPRLTGALANATTDPQAFTSAAEGQIRNGIACDKWTINDLKILQNVTVNL